MKKVDFLIIGAARSGTSALHNILQQHKNIYMPVEPPEPNFFFKTSEFDKGVDYYHDKYFFSVDNHLIKGEKSTSYFYDSKVVAKRIYDYNPSIKLILILRNPIDRAISNYIFTMNNGIELMDFNYAILQEEKRKTNYLKGKWQEIKPFDYLGRSNYYTELKHYFRYFSEVQFKILLYENFQLHKLNTINEIYEFLEVPRFERFIDKEVNKNRANVKIDIQDNTLEFMKSKLYKEVSQLSELLGMDLVKFWGFI